MQEKFFEKLVKEHTPVNIYLVSGIKLTGAITAFDNFAITLQASSEQLVYKHAIATVAPVSKPKEPNGNRA
jgi:host factor-I protein